MDIASYSTIALELANVEPYDDPDGGQLLAVLVRQWGWRPEQVTSADIADLRRLHHDLRAIMTAADDDDAAGRLNRLLRANPICPEISNHRHGDNPPEWHLHLALPDARIAEHAGAVCAMGLTAALLETGLDRRGSCDHGTCDDVFIDSSPGHTRRYCSDTCQNRANVAAYRARKRAKRDAGTG